MDDLEQRLLAQRWNGRIVSGGPDGNGVPMKELINPDGMDAADRLRTYREALSKIADPRNGDFRGDFPSIARQALKG